MTVTKPSSQFDINTLLKDISTWINVALTKTQHWLVDTTNYVLNQIFALQHTVAGLRSTIVWLLFFALAGIFIATSRSADDWSSIWAHLSEDGMTSLLVAVFLNPSIWARLIALGAPFWLMHRITSIYLADVFEKEEEVARLFILQAAFAGDYGKIRIREGKIVEADQNSPIVQIGGPGYIIVELDSAILFEKPDGTPHIIGPTTSGKQVVDGFERVRQVADLRDIMDSYELNARSRDGIIVEGKDIQYTYSIYRGENAVKTLKTPYPFDENALISLIYKAPRPVKPGVNPSSKADWLTSLPGKFGGSIQGELGGFVNKRGLSEFLSSIGEPERDALRNLEEKLDKDSQLLSGRNGTSPYEDFIKAVPFTSRASITAMFYSDGFKKGLAAGKGLQLNWIGVGTWVTPTKIIPDKHLEAWTLSRENATRNNPEQLKRLREEEHLQESLRLIQTMPIGQFYTELKQVEDDVVIDALIGDYYERIQSALEFFERDGQELPLALLNALHVLNEVRGTSHRWVNDL